MRTVLFSLVFVAAACAGGDMARVDAILDAREAVAEPAAELGTLAEAVVAAVTTVRLEGPTDPADWQAGVTAVADGPVASFADAVAAASAVELDGSTEDVQLAQQHWLRAQAAAADMLATVRTQLDELGRVIGWDLELRELTDSWQQSGSRSMQLAAFADTAAAADQLAHDLAVDAPTTCPEQRDRRVEAAEFVATATRELREHIAASRGAAFDERRRELAEDPTGLGQPLSDLDGQDARCWGSTSGVDSQAILDALGDLQAALNPPDL